jgi:hypothetical protein
MASKKRRWPRRVALGLGVTMGVGAVGYFAWWYNRATTLPPDPAERTLTEETVVLALCAATLAVIAAGFAWPAFRDWRREHKVPTVTIGWEAFRPDKKSLYASVAPDQFEYIPQQSFPDVYFQLIIKNDGPATIRNAIMNIRVLNNCDIDPADPERHHYLSPLPANDAEIVANKESMVRFTHAERDFPQGHHYIYIAKLQFPKDGSAEKWPILLTLEGDPEVALTKVVYALPSSPPLSSSPP